MENLIEQLNNEYQLSGKPEECIDTSNIDIERAEVNLITAQENLKALRNAINRRLTDYYIQRINQGDFDYNETLKNANEYLQKVADGKFVKTDMMYITIRPKDGTCIYTFMKKIEKCVKKVWIKNYLYVYEQVGMDDNSIGKGFHAHMLIHHESDKKKWSEFNQEITNTFKDILNPKVGIDYKNVLREVAYQNFYNYLIGTKDHSRERNRDKKLKQEYDVIFRQKYEMTPFYTNNEEFFKSYTLI